MHIHDDEFPPVCAGDRVWDRLDQQWRTVKSVSIFERTAHLEDGGIMDLEEAAGPIALPSEELPAMSIDAAGWDVLDVGDDQSLLPAYA